ncbi:MAG: aldehyde dehydrogenase family protein, partial [Acinetobacter sp.]
MQHYLNYFDGQWQDSSRQLEVINPATAQAFATVAQASIDDADAAMTAAHQCASSGALTDVRPAQRTAWLLKAADAIREMAAEGALILCRENGKNLETAREEFDEAARYFEYYAGMADKIEGISVPLGKDYIDFTSYIPMGVSVQIVPWN